jgi:hypothetical protein
VITGIQPFNEVEMLLGILYLASYLGLTLLSPVCVLAALFIAIRDALTRRRIQSES